MGWILFSIEVRPSIVWEMDCQYMCKSVESGSVVTYPLALIKTTFSAKEDVHVLFCPFSVVSDNISLTKVFITPVVLIAKSCLSVTSVLWSQCAFSSSPFLLLKV